MMDGDLHFPELTIAARRLGLNAYDLAEAMLCRLDSGEPYWSALHGVVREAAQRSGQYDGEVKARIDSGDVFTLRPAPMLETGGRMGNAIADDRADIFDALAMAAVVDAPASNAEKEVERRRAAKLAAVMTGEKE